MFKGLRASDESIAVTHEVYFILICDWHTKAQ